MADSPDPDRPHQHLSHLGLLARARGHGPTEVAQVAVVGCVFCAASVTTEPAAREGVGHRWAPQPGRGEGLQAAAPVGVEHVEVTGHVEGVWATSQRGAWRVSVGGRVVFARQGDGCVQALQAAARSGDQVRVATWRLRADLWADAVQRC